MKFALAWMQQNSAPWLRLHLPTMIDAKGIDGLVALDGGSTDDSREVVTSFGASVFDRPFDNNYSAQTNRLIECCESLGFDAMLRIDTDECLWRYEIAAIRDLLENFKLVWLSRYNFWRSRKRYSPQHFPDWQARAFRLNEGVRYEGKVHEQINYARLGWRDEIEVVKAGHLPIHHYGEIVPNALKHLNYARLSQDLPALTELPPDVDLQYTQAYRFSIPFIGPSPIDVDKYGEWAPFKDVYGNL